MRIFILYLSASLLLVSCSPRENTGNMTADSIIIENIFPYQGQHCHGSSVAELPDGNLIAVWFQGSGERTSDDVAIMGSRYNTKDNSWETPFLMADVPGFPDINPVVFVDRKKQLWLVWYTVMAYQWETSILKYRISDDYSNPGAPVWKWQDMIHMKVDGSVPEGIGKDDEYLKTLQRKYQEYFVASGDSLGIPEEMRNIALERYLNIAKGTNLLRSGTEKGDDGSLVRTQLGYPLMRRIGWQTRNKPLFAGDRILLPLYSDGFDHSIIAITDDYGADWHFSEPIVGAGNIQPALGFLKDSSIVAYMRDNGPPPQRLMKSISNDMGKTWSVVTNTVIPNPGSGADLVVLRSGNIAVVSNDLENGRHRLSVWLSPDEGKTWPYRKAIVNGVPNSMTRAHYPAIIQDSNGIIHVTYTNQTAPPEGRESVKNIAHAFFTEAWIMK